MEDEVDKERQSKWKIKGEDAGEEECAECVALKEKVSDLKFELEAEHRDAEKTIRDVEKMEDQHKQEIEKLYRELDFEKDKVVALTSTLDHERKARMQEIYKIERQSLEHDHNMKDYNFINEKNQNLGQEFEAVKRENETLINITKQLQDNKISILEQMKIYETQITELERKNTDLRKRLYDSDNEKDRHKVQAARMKQKLHDYLNGIGDRTMPKKETKTSSLGPLKSFSKKSMQGSVFSRADEGSAYTAGVGGNTAASNSYVSRHPYTGGGTGVDLETSNSMYSDTRLRSSQSASMLSSVNYIRKFNTDPRTVSNSKKKNPMLWPVPY